MEISNHSTLSFTEQHLALVTGPKLKPVPSPVFSHSTRTLQRGHHTNCCSKKEHPSLPSLFLSFATMSPGVITMASCHFVPAHWRTFSGYQIQTKYTNEHLVIEGEQTELYHVLALIQKARDYLMAAAAYECSWCCSFNESQLSDLLWLQSPRIRCY